MAKLPRNEREPQREERKRSKRSPASVTHKLMGVKRKKLVNPVNYKKERARKKALAKFVRMVALQSAVEIASEKIKKREVAVVRYAFKGQPKVPLFNIGIVDEIEWTTTNADGETLNKPRPNKLIIFDAVGDLIEVPFSELDSFSNEKRNDHKRLVSRYRAAYALAKSIGERLRTWEAAHGHPD